MNASGIQSAQMGFALFDIWQASLGKSKGGHGKGHSKAQGGDPLVAAACEAFEQYIHTAEIGMAAQIAGVAMYALNPKGNGAQGITAEQMAPFMALNVMG